MGGPIIDGSVILYLVGDAVPHDGANIAIDYTYTTISGKLGSGSRNVTLIGFAEKTFILNHPELEITFPFDFVNIVDLVISATIASVPPFIITSFVEDGPSVNSYTKIESNKLKFKQDLEAFGYNSNNSITFKISE